LLFSATISAPVEELMNNFLGNASKVSVGGKNNVVTSVK
jgi:superfamily II DNA/RNA helicase